MHAHRLLRARPPQAFELMRQRRQAELDAEKRRARTAIMDECRQRLEAYNAALLVPSLFACTL